MRLRPISRWAEAAFWISAAAAAGTAVFIAGVISNTDSGGLLGFSALAGVAGGVIGTIVGVIAMFDHASRIVAICALSLSGLSLAFWVVVAWWLSSLEPGSFS